MTVTNESLQRFVGGEMEIQTYGNFRPGVMRGKIRQINLVRDTLRIRLIWVAYCESYPPTTEWTGDDELDHDLSLGNFSIIESHQAGQLMFAKDRDLYVLFPPGQNQLDLSLVTNFGEDVGKEEIYRLSPHEDAKSKATLRLPYNTYTRVEIGELLADIAQTINGEYEDHSDSPIEERERDDAVVIVGMEVALPQEPEVRAGIINLLEDLLKALQEKVPEEELFSTE